MPAKRLRCALRQGSLTSKLARTPANKKKEKSLCQPKGRGVHQGMWKKTGETGKSPHRWDNRRQSSGNGLKPRMQPANETDGVVP
eukprot:922262-Pelagomonas_calceolata.AAC.4